MIENENSNGNIWEAKGKDASTDPGTGMAPRPRGPC